MHTIETPRLLLRPWRNEDLEPYARMCADPEVMRYQDTWPQGEHKTEVGWLIDRSYWGQGFATEGARESIHYDFEEIGLERIISIALPENIASRGVMEKCGLTFRGEAYWRDLDVVWHAIDRDEWEAGKPA